MKAVIDFLRKGFDFAIALVEFCKGKMAVNRSSNASEFRQILGRLEVGNIRFESSEQIVGHQWLP